MTDGLEKQHKALCDELTHHATLYYYGPFDEPMITDAEYDRMYCRLEEMEKENPELVFPESPTQRIGAPLPKRRGG